jgi:23S rRNA pseudouridine2604 synthase
MTAPPAPPDDPQRLSKVVAARAKCSRREAEQYIAEGWVRVDGQLVDQPQFRVGTANRVEIDPKARLQPLLPVTLLLHKPAGVAMEAARELLGAAGHWTGDRSGIRRVPSHAAGLVALLPLPPQAAGLCVFSQDARIVRKLTEDAALLEQELVAEVAGSIADDGLARLARGLQHDGRVLPPCRVSWQSEARLRFALKGIAPDAIEWMCAQVGLRLVALKRIRIGRIPMAGLPAGQWCYLPAGERF